MFEIDCVRVHECASVNNMAASIVSISTSNSTSFGRVLSHQSDTDNVLKLKLKKPKSWNWELSTSKSSAHIDFPRVLLYDNNDRLLADIEEANFIVNGKENDLHPMPMPNPSHSTEGNDRNRITRKSNSFCVSSSSTKSSLKSPPIIKLVESDSHSCGNDIAVNNTDNSTSNSCYERKSIRADAYKLNANPSVQIDDDDVIDSHNIPNDDGESEKGTPKLPVIPILIYSAKGLIQRDFNAKEFDVIRNRSNSQTNIKMEEPLAHSTGSGVHHTNKTTTRSRIDTQMKHSTGNHLQIDKNPLIKCSSMAEMLANQSVNSNSSRKVRRTKSATSTKHSYRSASRKLNELSLPLSSSSSTLSTLSLSLNQLNQCNSTNNKKPTYHIQKSAAGALIIPETINSNGREHRRRRRRRHRSNSYDGIERTLFENNKVKSNSNYLLKYKTTMTSNSDTMSNPMDMSPVDETTGNQLNGVTSFAHNKHTAHNNNNNNNKRNKHSTSIKSENETYRLSAQGGSVLSLANSNNDINRSNINSNSSTTVDTKQKRVQQQHQQLQQFHRKVSFVHANDGIENKSSNDTIRNRIQQTNEFNQNGKCISTIKSATGRRKKLYGKIKKSASVTGYFCRNHCDSERKSASDTDDSDFYMKPPMRRKKRRVTQRSRSSTATTSPEIATTTASATVYHSKSIICNLI